MGKIGKFSIYMNPFTYICQQTCVYFEEGELFKTEEYHQINLNHVKHKRPNQ